MFIFIWGISPEDKLSNRNDILRIEYSKTLDDRKITGNEDSMDKGIIIYRAFFEFRGNAKRMRRGSVFDARPTSFAIVD